LIGIGAAVTRRPYADQQLFLSTKIQNRRPK
jgi:hypothetical protein